MLEELKKSVCEANHDLVNKGVVIYTWGNVSGISDDRKYMVIKPSGVDYDGMSPEDMVVVDIATGESVEGKWKPSSDTKTHLELYRKYQEIKGIVHTHSVNAVAFAQAGMAISAFGKTPADYFFGDIPCTPEFTKQEVKDYIRYIADRRLMGLGLKPIFKSEKNPLNWVDAMLGVTHTNFFENRVVDYAKGALTGSWADVWGAASSKS